MCGRVSYPDTRTIVSKTGLKYTGEPLAENINAAPTTGIPVVDSDKPGDLQYKKWWLIPWYSKTGKPDKASTFNARYDKLLISPLWKPIIEKRQMCVVITTGYYEWEILEPENKKSPKQPWLIRAKGEDFTYLAGLWEDWTSKAPVRLFLPVL